MYTLKTGFAKPLVGSGEWLEVDFSNISFADIYTTYRNAIVVLTNPFVQTPVAFDLEKLRYHYAASPLTVSAFLINNADKALDTTTNIPKIKEQYAKYKDAFAAGYTINAVNPDTAPDAELTTGAKDWLHLSKAGLNYELFKKTCLVFVNGFFHFADVGTDGIWVDSGMKSVLRANQNTVGIVSFAGISTFTTKRITDDMIGNQGAVNQLGVRSYVDVGVDITNKGIGLVLGGYLHVLDSSTFYRVGDSRICIDFNNLPLFERFYESGEVIDFTELGLTKSDVNDSVFATSELLSDKKIRRYLKMPQTFLIVFDNPELMVKRVPIQDVKLPNVYQSELPPVYPVTHGYGKMANYITEYSGGAWNILPINTYKKRFAFNTSFDYLKAPNVSDVRVTEKMSESDKLWFYLIGSNIQFSA